MFSRRQIFIAAPAYLTLASSRFALAAESSESADTLVRSLGDDAIHMLANASLSQQQREGAFRDLLHRGFDVDLIGQLALGRFWRQATDAQKTEYRKLFEAFIVKSYLARLGHYAGETFQVRGSRPNDDGDVTVQSEIDRPNEQPLHVDWRVRKADAGYKIIDVTVDGISEMATHREEFAAIIQHGGGRIDSLLDQLRQRTASLN
jgi:phospholipid transport system substrate-binding protein